jgi:hypothetical protein
VQHVEQKLNEMCVQFQMKKKHEFDLPNIDSSKPGFDNSSLLIEPNLILAE